MNWDQIQGKWTELKGLAKEKWGDLTDDELDKLEGKRERLAGLVQQKYGIAKEEVEKQIRDFERSCNC
ncbi:MAG: CsbD family protein [Pirellulaceae bacterium]|nr:CsbD family protein [Pirellulaceae bacterium]